MYFNVLKNTYKLGLWKAALRKVFSQTTQDSVSEQARNWYTAEAISLETLFIKLGVNQDEFNFIPPDNLSHVDRNKIKKDLSGDSNPSEKKRAGMGGVANMQALYMLVRAKEKKSCLECGVSMGGSSYAILKGLKDNKKGTLYSNDLPYLWMDDPLKDQGILVPNDLKNRWQLFIGDDQDNLPLIFSQMGSKDIDLAHYDSDKSYSARTRFWEFLKPHLSEFCTIIFDDIVDNDHFYDLSSDLHSKWETYVVIDDQKLFGVIQRI